MKSGRILKLMALIGALSLTGCRAWCDRYNPPAGYGNCGCSCAPQPCCAPASNYPLQPCAPAAPNWSVPQH